MASDFHVFYTPEETHVVNMGTRVSKRTWNIYPAMIKKTGQSEPCVAFQYRNSKRMTFLQRRHILMFVDPVHIADSDTYINEFIRTALIDGGLDPTSAVARQSLVSIMDEVIDQITEWNTGWHKEITNMRPRPESPVQFLTGPTGEGLEKAKVIAEKF